VIVNNFNIGSAFGSPNKANSPLVINPYAVLTSPISLKQFQAIPRWYSQIFKHQRPIQLRQFPQRWPFNIDPFANSVTFKKQLRIFAFEALDGHGLNSNAMR
jgi:hypothetical protein